MMGDERMKQLGSSMPFDGQRMIYGGFAPLIDEGSGRGSYVDGFIVPVPDGKKDAYRALARKAAAVFKEYGALRVVEAWGNDVPHGKTTDSYRAIRRPTARRSSSPGSSGPTRRRGRKPGSRP
jgi:uncharacterized protein YbaA (DUF1428 family)